MLLSIRGKYSTPIDCGCVTANVSICYNPGLAIRVRQSISTHSLLSPHTRTRNLERTLQALTYFLTTLLVKAFELVTGSRHAFEVVEDDLNLGAGAFSPLA